MVAIFRMSSWTLAAMIVGGPSIASRQGNIVAAEIDTALNNKMFALNIAQFNSESMAPIGFDMSQHEEESSIGGGVDENGGDVQEIFFYQTLDHFGERHSVDMFEQRYFYSDRFVHRTIKTSLRSSTSTFSIDKTPVYAFLCVGGEGPPLDKSVLIDSVHCTGDMIALAEKLHNEEQASVHLYALEHRYYGKSTPAENGKISNENDAKVVSLDGELDISGKRKKRRKHYQYLSSRQAQADVASFITLQNAGTTSHSSYEYPSVKWVTFGGSYPGMMAAWARYRFPHLIHASVSNSAPVQAQLDFPEFFDAVGMSLEYDVVGGSKECRTLVEKGHEDLGRLLSLDQDTDILQKNQKMVADLFEIEGGATALDNARNLQMFMGQGVIFLPIQSNDPSCKEENCNIEQICDTLLENSKSMDAVESLAALHRRQMQSHGINSTDISHENYDKEFTSDPNNMSWAWQTCAEFGFYQTCEVGSNCPFAKGYLPLDSFLNDCENLFGIGPEEAQQNVNSSNEWYGGWDIQATRILSVNGNVDPWSQLARTPDHKHPTRAQPTIWVEGASHHFWTHAPKDTDDNEIGKARDTIYQTVTGWLKENDDDPATLIEVQEASVVASREMSFGWRNLFHHLQITCYGIMV